ncbi:MAG: DUF805 domain-containing protein [Patescibacteria group bacterium]|nr:DUF805 domain-containing protein [Patescibacteria group bacterium]MDE2015640.1 DUF805 domain-containing protein [Patescibacteria group bacterium]MDE2226697.1 DUF805 domain-containing protein [Patescibacteria group bacterium]
MDFFLGLFRGRLNQGYFFLAWLMLIPLALLLLIFQIIFVNLNPAPSFFVILIFLVSLEIRRLHDIGKSSVWLCMALLLGPASFLLALIPGQRGDNKYGPEPPAKIGLINATLNLDKSNHIATPGGKVPTIKSGRKMVAWVLVCGILITLSVLTVHYFIKKQDALNEWRSQYRYIICKDGNCIYANKYAIGQYGCVFAEEVMGGGIINKLCGEYKINNNPLYYNGSAD